MPREKRLAHLVWARLRSVIADPSSAKPAARVTPVPFRLSSWSAWHEEQTAVKASSSSSRTLARLRERSRTSREIPACGRGFACYRRKGVDGRQRGYQRK